MLLQYVSNNFDIGNMPFRRECPKNILATLHHISTIRHCRKMNTWHNKDNSIMWNDIESKLKSNLSIAIFSSFYLLHRWCALSDDYVFVSVSTLEKIFRLLNRFSHFLLKKEKTIFPLLALRRCEIIAVNRKFYRITMLGDERNLLNSV